MTQTIKQYAEAPNQFIKASNGVIYAYRELGDKTGTPIILFIHLSGNLDNWDPRVVDGLAKNHWVFTFDYQGVGLSTGTPQATISEMAADGIAFIKALNFTKVDILGFSMGGMVAQEVLEIEPRLVRRMILGGTGPRGGQGIENVIKISDTDTVKAIFTLKDVKTYLFFTRTTNGKQKAKEFLARLKERTTDRDNTISWKAYRTQLKAIKNWGEASPADLSKYNLPVLVANGDHDKMVPTPNSHDLADRFPNSQLIIYPDAGHAGIFQNYAEFVNSANHFLDK
ncbi:putative non-heme bromoperoxidase BpoC [Lentilactobacillus sunkii]|jgi:pimeloyl-ACP methyl ester carboxylesterase|uniref:Putative non-heme bromoperoxidase BpoC n=1 Tax=Lentilactobacillus sunkii TaxID=481719 RepID=A0A1E7XGM5_9LACO|nr:alpha/beta hydrolase [Lentilactobacillus sunkii]OFA12244.1 putative non-heme bromoperoxidase BpoC [Lentilactobacillus sunkii]